MKPKAKFITRQECRQWIKLSNSFANSLIPQQEALKQFNSLDAKTRIAIVHSFEELDSIRRQKLTKNDGDAPWFLSVIVDAHIIATEHNIDPLTVIMCVHPPCKVFERVYIK